MSRSVGPGKLFETEEEEVAEHIEMIEWATQVTPEEFDRFYAVLKAVLDSQCCNFGGLIASSLRQPAGSTEFAALEARSTLWYSSAMAPKYVWISGICTSSSNAGNRLNLKRARVPFAETEEIPKCVLQASFYGVQVGALETQEFRTTPVPFWPVGFSDTVPGPLKEMYFVVVLPDGTIVEPGVAKRLQAQKAMSRIDVDPHGWGDAQVSDIQTVLVSTLRCFEAGTGMTIAVNIRVKHQPGAPLTWFQLDPDGRTVISLTAQGRHWCQYMYQCSHELCHVATNYNSPCGR